MLDQPAGIVGPADCPVDCTAKNAQSCAVVGVSVALGDVEFPVVADDPSKIPPIALAVGPAKTVFPASEVQFPVRVPVVVTGEPEIENCGGSPRPTLLTLPEPPGKSPATRARKVGTPGAAFGLAYTRFCA